LSSPTAQTARDLHKATTGATALFLARLQAKAIETRGVEIRLRVNSDASSIVIRVPRSERHCEIPQDQVGAVTVEFQAVGEDFGKICGVRERTHERSAAC
jgi:hypothetical protein